MPGVSVPRKTLGELIFSPWPYIAVYEIIGDCAQVLRIRHAPRIGPRVKYPEVAVDTGEGLTSGRRIRGVSKL